MTGRSEGTFDVIDAGTGGICIIWRAGLAGFLTMAAVYHDLI